MSKNSSMYGSMMPWNKTRYRDDNGGLVFPNWLSLKLNLSALSNQDSNSKTFVIASFCFARSIVWNNAILALRFCWPKKCNHPQLTHALSFSSLIAKWYQKNVRGFWNSGVWFNSLCHLQNLILLWGHLFPVLISYYSWFESPLNWLNLSSGFLFVCFFYKKSSL